MTRASPDKHPRLLHLEVKLPEAPSRLPPPLAYLTLLGVSVTLVIHT